MTYRLISINYWNKNINVLMESLDIYILFSRYEMIMKYKKHFSHCPKTDFDRKMFKSIERKLLKELHNNELGDDIFGLIYNHNIAIQEIESKKVISSKRFFTLFSGFIPFEQTDEYKSEDKHVNSILSSDWQNIRYNVNFKYFNL